MMNETLLYSVFDYLRRHGVPIGVSEYLLAMQFWMTVDDPEHLKRLCGLLWAKSLEDWELVKIAFEHFVEPQLKAASAEPVNDKPAENQDITDKPVPEPEPTLPSEPVEDIPENVVSPSGTPSSGLEKVRGMGTELQWLTDFGASGRSYQLTPRFPMDSRSMAAAWRHLRKLHRTGPLEELDVVATIDDICRKGLFCGPVLRPRQRNQARLLLLIDREGSMVPFTPLMDLFIESILRGGSLRQLELYYFHDCPEGILYSTPSLIGAQALEDVLRMHAADSSVLIVSDAGAARGSYEKRRIENTKTFIDILRAYTYTYAWFNPLPSSRWKVTSAEDISQLVPMASLDWNGLNDLVAWLRGQPYLPGVSC